MNDLIRTARSKVMELHYKTKAGHLGGSLSCIDALVVLYTSILEKEDVFVLSKGHSASALYVALWLVGHIDDKILDTYCMDATKLGGHPPVNTISEILFGSGSLGHGLSLASGVALGKKINRQGGRVFCLCSDGEFQEGSIWEAVIFSVHNQLGNLCVLVDCNGWQGFGSTVEVASMHLGGLASRLQSFGVSVDQCDGHNWGELLKRLNRTQGQTIPQVLLMQTCKGKGAPCFEGQLVSHYAKLTEEQFNEAVSSLGCCE